MRRAAGREEVAVRYSFAVLAACLACVVGGFWYHVVWMQALELFLLWMIGFFVKHPERSWYRW